jgi:hypothetical protein
VQLLLECGAPPGCKAEDGITALHVGELHYILCLLFSSRCSAVPQLLMFCAARSHLYTCLRAADCAGC